MEKSLLHLFIINFPCLNDEVFSRYESNTLRYAILALITKIVPLEIGIESIIHRISQRTVQITCLSSKESS